MGIAKKTGKLYKGSGMSKDAYQQLLKQNTNIKSGSTDYSAVQQGIRNYMTQQQQSSQSETQRRQDVLANVDTSTVSGRIQQQAGMAGFDDPRSQDIIKGAQFGEAVIGPEGLGRMAESDTLKAMEAQAAELAKGFSSEEMLARQEKGIESIQGSTQAQSRAAQAALARAGVKGGAAGQQLANIAMSGVQARGNLERDLIIQNREAQLQGLQAQQGVYSQRTDLEKFNLSQAAKEKDIALQSGLGFAQMGANERGAELNRQAQISAAKASKQKSCFLGNTEVVMADGSVKRIEDLKLGDNTKGGIVYTLMMGLVTEIYDYNGVYVTGHHAVLDQGTWKRVKDTNAELVEGIFTVYNINTGDHRIFSNGIEFADFDETDMASEINDEKSLEELNANGNELLERGRGL